MKSRTIWLVALIASGIWPAAVQGGDVVDGEVDIQAIITALRASDLSANEIRAIDSYVRLDVVDLSAFESSDQYQALETALANTDDGWAMLQTAIVGNDSIKQELRRRSVEIRRIVAATTDDEGVVTIYTR